MKRFLFKARSAVLSAKNINCPYSILNGPGVVLSNDYEMDYSYFNSINSSNYSLSYYYGLNTDSFCGRYSTNYYNVYSYSSKGFPHFRYVSIQLSTLKLKSRKIYKIFLIKICFAYKSNLDLYYIYLWSNSNNKYMSYYINYKFITDNQWHYDCIDLYGQNGYNSSSLVNSVIILIVEKFNF